MQFIHYSAEQLDTWRPVSYLQRQAYKPSGMWFSVEDAAENDQNWYTWCHGEEWGLERLTFRHKLTLVEKPNLLILDTPDKMLAFTKQYARNFTSVRNHFSHVNWPAVTAKYSGIAIYPYFWQFRLESLYSWYYPWDCASGCVWDINIIKSIKIIT